MSVGGRGAGGGVWWRGGGAGEGGGRRGAGERDLLGGGCGVVSEGVDGVEGWGGGRDLRGGKGGVGGVRLDRAVPAREECYLDGEVWVVLVCDDCEHGLRMVHFGMNSWACVCWHYTANISNSVS